MEGKETPEVKQPATTTAKVPAPLPAYNAYAPLHHQTFV